MYCFPFDLGSLVLSVLPNWMIYFYFLNELAGWLGIKLKHGEFLLEISVLKSECTSSFCLDTILSLISSY